MMQTDVLEVRSPQPFQLCMFQATWFSSQLIPYTKEVQLLSGKQ